MHVFVKLPKYAHGLQTMVPWWKQTATLIDTQYLRLKKKDILSLCNILSALFYTHAVYQLILLYQVGEVSAQNLSVEVLHCRVFHILGTCLINSCNTYMSILTVITFAQVLNVTERGWQHRFEIIQTQDVRVTSSADWATSWTIIYMRKPTLRKILVFPICQSSWAASLARMICWQVPCRSSWKD